VKRRRSNRRRQTPTTRGPRIREIGRNRLLHSLAHHLQCLPDGLRRMLAQPIGSLFTLGVIGIALALPFALTTLLDNARSLTDDVESLDQITVFLIPEAEQSDAQALRQTLLNDPVVETISLRNPDEALLEFRDYSGFGDALDVLDSNPLPWVLIVDPANTSDAAPASAAWIETLEADSRVDFAQVDMQWLQRLNAIMDLAERVVYSVGALLLIAALLIIGNTIRLEIQNRSSEIEISKLMGATDGYVRRPFLYSGLWYGLGGGVIACLLVTGLLSMLQSASGDLAQSYQSDLLIRLPDISRIGVLLATSLLVGLCGSAIAVSRQIAQIQPD